MAKITYLAVMHNGITAATGPLPQELTAFQRHLQFGVSMHDDRTTGILIQHSTVYPRAWLSVGAFAHARARSGPRS
jgi:hypothetical protein